MKIAILFWGLTRSLKYTIKSIESRIFEILKKNSIDYDIYLHTYHFKSKYVNNRAKEKGIKLDFDEYKLLNPDYFILEDQDIIRNKLNMKKYRSKPDPWHTNYQTVDNFILAMHSKSQVTKLMKSQNINYDYCLFIRPDVKYLNDFNVKWFDLIKNNTICVPSFHHKAFKFNDRMALANYPNSIIYGTLFEYMLEYSKKNRLHSETFNRCLLTKLINNYKTIFIPFYFNRVRCNGREQNDCNKLVNKK